MHPENDTPPPARWYVRLVRRYLGPGPYLVVGGAAGSPDGELLRRLAERGSATGFETSERAAAVARRAAPGCPVHTTPDDLPGGVFRGVVAVHALDTADTDTAKTDTADTADTDDADDADTDTGDAADTDTDTDTGDAADTADTSAAAALACWRRVLVPGGRVLVVVRDAAVDAAGGGPREGRTGRSHDEWRDLLVAGGFRVVREGSDAPPRGAGLRAVVAGAQHLAGRLFLRPGSGRSALFVAERVS